MRLWPWRRRAPAVLPPTDDLLLTDQLVRRDVEEALVVREGAVVGGVLAWRGHLRLPPARALEVLQTRLRPLGLTPFIRAEGGDVVVQAVPMAEVTERPRIRVNVVLFVITCVSMLVAGSSFSGSPTFDAFRASVAGTLFVSGIPFAAPLLAILLVHEFGHYFTARYYRASVSLPYFIPAPLLFGTLGAIIRMRSPARDRNTSFDIAAAGPLAGLAVAVPALLIGLEWSRVIPIPAAGYLEFGESILMHWFVQLRFGPLPHGMMIYTHPMADAAWAGFFVTALNLFPVGQLDGGRIAYALFSRHHQTVGKAALAGCVAVGALVSAAGMRTGNPFQGVNWFIWAGLIFFLIGFHHSPPLDDVTPLTPGRRMLGIGCLLLFVLLIPPIPIR